MFWDFLSLGLFTLLIGPKDVVWVQARRMDVYDSSITPSHLPFDTYNYCNAAHVSAAHYEYPTAPGAVLKHVTLFMRHHKVRSHGPSRLVPSLFPAVEWP